MLHSTTFSSVIFLALASFVKSIELTFELPDNANQCYYEDVEAGTECTVEMQVVTGGQYDVDMKIEGPTGEVLYQDVRKQYDSYTWKAKETGAYKVCFSNEFSTFSHKIVYMDFIVGDEKPLMPDMKHLTAMTYLETSSDGIHDRLRKIDDLQTHHRLREATGRKRAEDLNERVMLWSVGQTVIIMCIGIRPPLILHGQTNGRSSTTHPTINNKRNVIKSYCVKRQAD